MRPVRTIVGDIVGQVHAAFHMARARMYWGALEHHGHTGPDGELLTRRALESQLIVDRFTMGRA